MRQTSGRNLLLGLLLIGLWSCAGDPNSALKSKNNPTTDSLTPLEQEVLTRKGLKGTRIRLDQGSFYSRTEPNPQSCAGDAKKFGPFPSAESAEDFLESLGDPGETLRPTFIKNIAVDITDSSLVTESNRSLACSIRPTIDSKPSRCASFDLGATDSVGLSLDSNLLLIGGRRVDGASFEDEASEFSLVIPGPRETSSNTVWNDLIQEELLSTGSTVRPRARWGAAQAYHPGRQEFFLFGGSTQLASTATQSLQPLAESWSLNLETRKWEALLTTVPPRLNTQLDGSLGSVVQTAKSPSARTNFGYLPIAGLSYSDLSSGSTDSTIEKLLIVGGLSQLGMQDSYLFNPTFGPEHVKLPSADGIAAAGELQQWIESYHTRRISTLNSRTFFGNEILQKPNFLLNLSSSTVDLVLNQFKIEGHILSDGDQVTLAATYASSTAPGGLSFQSVYQVCNVVITPGGSPADSFQLCNSLGNVIDLTTAIGSGSITFVRSPGPVQGALAASGTDPVWIGGFGYLSDAPGRPSAPLVGKASKMIEPSPAGIYSPEVGPPRYELDLDGRVLHEDSNQIHTWESGLGFGNTPGSPGELPGYGAFSLFKIPGLSPDRWLYVGGTSCAQYLTTANNLCTFNNSLYRLTSLYPPASDPPLVDSRLARAGMAAASGTTTAGTSVMVFFGGLSVAATPITGTTANDLFLVTDDGSASTVYLIDSPTISGGGSGPPPLVNAQMVFSHVTRKFYLFGGMVPQSLSATRGETWELTISAINSSNTSATWRKLDGAGLTCWPNCPQARRSHRMAEVNYQTNATCTSDSPCTYGIFMEGGTPNGLDYLSDRWMFDPTANNGAGHWSNVNGFPSRRNAAMTSYEVTLPNGSTQLRAVMFGGETAMEKAHFTLGSAEYFLPPILGDTETYDFETKSWNRTQLLGRGYRASTPVSGTEFYKESFVSGAVSSLSPPPLASPLMVTRTHDGLGSKLTVPEIYLMGGRLKDGSFQPLLTEVWKFCPQSPGETLAGPAVTNRPCESEEIQDAYSGRWHLKTTLNPSGADTGAYASSATYDAIRDRIIVYGGYISAPASGVDKITEASNSRTQVLELNPTTLTWETINPCGFSAPAPRYGHSLSYDSQANRLVLVGGFAIQSIASGDTGAVALEHSATDSTPEVWTAAYDSAGSCYSWSKLDPPESSTRVDSRIPPPHGSGYMSGLQLPPKGYGTQAYLLQDDQCAGTGPIASNDSALSKKFSGGVTIDLERGELESDESLLLQFTYIPLTRDSTLASRSPATSQDEPVLQIHLISTNLPRSALQSVFQPRHLFFFDSQEFPRVVDKLSILAERDGQLREEQLVVPLPASSSIDRIRIERVSGSAILLDVSVQRLGVK